VTWRGSSCGSGSGRGHKMTHRGGCKGRGRGFKMMVRNLRIGIHFWDWDLEEEKKKKRRKERKGKERKGKERKGKEKEGGDEWFSNGKKRGRRRVR